MIANSPRKHRKRSSDLRLSVDTTHLPEYPAVILEDSPPDYSSASSAGDADEDTDSSHTKSTTSKLKRHASRRHPRKQTSTDFYLDSLLARSVHALEMSNTLLQTSMSTQSSLSNLLAVDSPIDTSVEARVQRLSSRIRDNRGVHESWKAHLEEIGRDVERLFGDNGHVGQRPLTPVQDYGMSSSLPSTSHMPPRLKHHRRPTSLEFKHAMVESDMPQLNYGPQERSHLISPPCALTQFTTASADPDSITMPSTIGLQSLSQCWKTATSAHLSHSPKAAGKETAHGSCAMFSSQQGSPPAPSGLITPGCSPALSRASSISRPRPINIHPDDLPHREPGSARNRTPRTLDMNLPLTPPAEESSSDDCRAKMTLQSLRKILDQQPQAAPRTPRFAITPPPVPQVAASHATASISRLFTKPTHTASTRARSPTRSSLKSARSTPTPSPSTLSVPDSFGQTVRSLGGGSNPSSGHSTPKRISFAELPEPYSSTRPEGSRGRVPSRRRKHQQRKSDSDGELEGLGWFAKFLLGSSRPLSSENDEWRGWGPGVRSYGGGMGDWNI